MRSACPCLCVCVRPSCVHHFYCCGCTYLPGEFLCRRRVGRGRNSRVFGGCASLRLDAAQGGRVVRFPHPRAGDVPGVSAGGRLDVAREEERREERRGAEERCHSGTPPAYLLSARVARQPQRTQMQSADAAAAATRAAPRQLPSPPARRVRCAMHADNSAVLPSSAFPSLAAAAGAATRTHVRSRQTGVGCALYLHTEMRAELSASPRSVKATTWTHTYIAG